MNVSAIVVPNGDTLSMFVSRVLLLYGVCACLFACFSICLFRKPFRRRSKMNLMVLLKPFGSVGSFYPAK